MEEVTCKQFVRNVNLDRSWRVNGETTIKISAYDVLNSNLFIFDDENELWVDEDGNKVKIVDEDNMKVLYEATTE